VVLYLASNNPGKLREFHQAAFESGFSVEPVPCINDLPPCVEDGSSFEENARKKALHYSAYVQGLTFADDSGLCVDALGGAPGIHSARFGSLKSAQSQSDTGVLNVSRDDVNNLKLLRQLEGVPTELRTAHYVCVIALAQNGRVLKMTEGRVNGLITSSPRGSGGFGYDPYFFYPPVAKTFAELSLENKFSVSHRGHAFRRLLAGLNHIMEPRHKEESDR